MRRGNGLALQLTLLSLPRTLNCFMLIGSSCTKAMSTESLTLDSILTGKNALRCSSITTFSSQNLRRGMKVNRGPWLPIVWPLHVG